MKRSPDTIPESGSGIMRGNNVVESHTFYPVREVGILRREATVYLAPYFGIFAFAVDQDTVKVEQNSDRFHLSWF